MTTSLNKHSCEFAPDQVKQGHVVLGQIDDWSEHQPSAKAENEFVETSEHTKARGKVPDGDFGRVHRCGLIAAEARAARQKDLDIEDAAIGLREMTDKQNR